MGDVPDQPHPLDADEIAKIKECLGAGSIVWHWSYVARLVATVEAQATEIKIDSMIPILEARVRELEAQLGDAHNVIRRYDEGWTPDDSCDGPTWYLESGIDDDPDDFDGIEPMTSGEVDAIKQARETSG